jgi:NitT/TauT family transport system substrate-binding protein
MVAQFLMVKHGLKADDASFVGVGAGASAVAAILKGEIDAIANVDPVIAKLEASGDVVALADTRTTAGCEQAFGGTMSAAVAYLRRDFLERNPNTVQALVNAFYQALRWLETASPEQIADTVPQEYWLGDKALYLAAVKANLQVYSRDGVVSEASRTRSLNFLRQLDKEMAAAQVDPAKTWDGRFIAKAAMAAR